MVSPKFWPDEKIFRRKILGPKFGPQIFAKFWRKFDQNFRGFSAKIFQTYKEKKSENFEEIFGPENSRFREFSPKISRPTKKKNQKNSENPTDHLPVKMTYFGGF